MKKTILAAMSVILLILTGCATTYYLRPVIDQSESVELIYFEGHEVAISRGQKTLVGLYGMKTAAKNITLCVVYLNNTDQERFDVIPENITVIGLDTQGKSSQFKVYSAEEYLKKMRTAQAWAFAFQSMGGAMEASSAARSTSHTTASVYGSEGYAYGSATTTTYDKGKEAEINARNREQLQRSAELYARNNAATEQGLLKRNTLFPGQYAEGNVMVKLNTMYSTKFIVTVPIGNEKHIITFVPKK